MKNRKETKAAALRNAELIREEKSRRSEELRGMDPVQRKAAQASDRAIAKADALAQKNQRKIAMKSMTSSERRNCKRETRIFRKVKNRRRRAVGWAITGGVVIVLVIFATPFVADISRVFKMDVDSTTAEGVDARVYSQAVSQQIADEGLVLLKNEEGILPLDGGKVNVFGFTSFNLRYGGGGSGGADQSQAIPLYEALEMEGVQYNTDLHQTMVDNGAKTTSSNASGLIQVVSSMFLASGEDEIAPDYLTDDVMANAVAFSHTAMMVIGNDGVESQDFTAEQLRLTDTQIAMLDRITADFDNVILVVNSGNQMELGFLDQYPQIKGAIWIGTPGPGGGVSLAKTLAGEVNPSGRLTSTYAYDVESAPAAKNFGNFKYDNASRGFINYEEGIYVGYRYYETVYEGDEVGYQQAVQFPFGFGLSYTDFDWVVSEPVIDGQTLSVDVSVTNTGARAGKDVVEVYYSAPYIPGGIEKSAIELGGYAKTSMLEPGASETLTLTLALRDMASWDGAGGGGYVLDGGNYSLYVSRNIHEPVRSFEFAIDETKVFKSDAVTGADLENRFDYASGDLTFLSRADWDATYPDPANRSFTASDDLLDQMQTLSSNLADGTVKPIDGEIPTYGAHNDLRLEDMKGLQYDDPQWELFLDQFSSNDLVQLFSRGAYSTHAIPRLGIPSATLLDGPAGLNSFFSKMTAASFPTAVVVASTWNDQLAYALGEAIGLEANAYGVQGWYAPGMNIQRTAMGGRNFEYYSEDPVLSGKIGASMVAGAQDQGVLTFMKHFVLNEQETNARTGVNVFVDEQALREIYMKSFEITVKEGGANGAMSSFIHVGPKWSGGNPELLQDVLRTEWGFDGLVSTDAVLGSFMDPAQAATSGNELMLAPLSTPTVRTTFTALNNDPVGIGNALRDRAHQISYSLLQTDLFQ